MGKYIIKVPERDLYVEWSTVVDDALSWGDYADMVSDGFSAERLDRAAERGHSRLDRSAGFEGAILRGIWWLPAENLGAYLDLIGEGVEDGPVRDWSNADLKAEPRFLALVENPDDEDV